MFRQLILTCLLAVCLNCAQFGSAASDDRIQGGRTSEASEIGPIMVLTRDGTMHKLSTYQVSDSLLIATGTSEKNGVTREFSGSLRLSDVDYVYEERQWTTGKVILVAAGVAIFASAAAYGLNDKEKGVAVNAQSNWENCDYGSCPYVYTYDGKAYHLESESFAGAVFKGAERASYDVLRRLEPVDGRYIMKMTNVRDETQYVNEFKLLAVDVPPGVKVIPDRTGRLHTITDPVLPDRCTDASGKDVLAAVTSEDTSFWESDLGAKDLTRADQLRDGLTLEFRKPKDAATAKVVVNGMNTPLGEFAFKTLFALKGRNLIRWYQQLERDPSERDKVINWMKREGMLHVSLWGGEGWIEQTALPDVGPTVAKDQVAVIDLRDATDDTVKIKLECALDLWRIDRVYVDYSTDIPVVATEAEVVTAVNGLGEDVSDLLRSDDDLYYGSIRGEYVDLTFDSVPVAENTTRTYVLKTKGHYYLWCDAEGDDQTAILQLVLAEPLFGSKAWMERWRQVRPGR